MKWLGDRTKCSIDGCSDKYKANGYCNKHDQRVRKYGSPDIVKKYNSITKICILEMCEAPHFSKGYCQRHFMSFRRLGDAMSAKNRKKDICKVDNCKSYHHALGYCRIHYERFRKNGDPLKLQHRSKGEGCISKQGYKIITKYDHPNANKYGRILEHQFVMASMLGRPLRKGENVHHKNGNRLDNRPENLELWVTNQPIGQRPKDLVKWAKEIIELYGDEVE